MISLFWCTTIPGRLLILAPFMNWATWPKSSTSSRRLEGDTGRRREEGMRREEGQEENEKGREGEEGEERGGGRGKEEELRITGLVRSADKQ
jgi:hypothetical protein